MTSPKWVPQRTGRTIGALIAAALVVLAGCSPDPATSAAANSSPQASAVPPDRCAANRDAGTIKYVSPFGFDASAGILDVFAAKKLGYFGALCLDVEFVTHATNSSSLVSSNTAHVTNIGSAADLMNGIGNGANLVGVATYGDTSNYALLTTPDVTDLRQLEGKSVAYHGVLPVVLERMLAASGAEKSKIDFVLSNNYDPNQLFEGNYQALQAYRSNEPVVLRAHGKKFHEFTPSEFGVPGTFNIQTFNGDFLADHQEAAADFVRAELHAFDHCSRHEEQCVSILGEYAAESGAKFDAQHAASVWRFESQLARKHTLTGKGVGVHSAAEWRPELRMMNDHLDKRLPPLKHFQNTDIVAGLYHGTNLEWPG